MKNGGNAFAFIAGLSAGILNLLVALVTLFNALIALAYVPEPALAAAAAALLAVAGVNFAGGCACRRNRIAGGILMLSGALPLLLFGAACLYLALSMPDFFTNVIGAEFGESVRYGALGAGILLTLTELLSIAAAVVSLKVPAKPETPPHAENGETERSAELNSDENDED